MTDDFLEGKKLTYDTFDVLMSVITIAEYEIMETIEKRQLLGFFRQYIKGISKHRINKALNELHEEGYIFINTLTSISTTKLGIKTFNEIYEVLYQFERSTLRPLTKAITSGKITKFGDLIPHNNIPKRQDNPYNPFTGIFRLQNHLWGAYVKVNNEEIMIGAYKKAVEAGRARDAYIIKHGLKARKSIKY